MIRINKILATVLPLFFIASCAKDGAEVEAPGDYGEIKFEIGFAPDTRVATDADFKTTWDDWDEIGVFVTKTTGGGSADPLRSSGNYIDNLKLTYENGSWKSATTTYFPNDGEFLNFYAYYPYRQNIDPLNAQFSVETDQSAEANYNKSELLVAKAEVQRKSTDPVPLLFSHAFSLVQVEVKREANAPHFDGNFKVELTGVMTEATFDLGSSYPPETGSPADIVMHKVDGLQYTYRAIVPTQTLGASATVRFTQTTTGKVINETYTGISSTELTDGRAYKYRIRVNPYGVNPNHVYSVGDVYPHTGPVVGIVYEVTNGGKNGKVFSLDNSYGKWSNYQENMVDVKDGNNGINNMRGVAEFINTNTNRNWSDFPAFQWVHAKNGSDEKYTDEDVTGVWYLPARREGEELGNVYRAYGDFNTKLSGAGGTVFTGDPDDWHWTSSQCMVTDGYMWNPANGITGTYDYKTVNRRVRGILAF